MQVLLEGGATIELQDALGRSALMFAAGNGAAAACQVQQHEMSRAEIVMQLRDALLLQSTLHTCGRHVCVHYTRKWSERLLLMCM